MLLTRCCANGSETMPKSGSSSWSSTRQTLFNVNYDAVWNYTFLYSWFTSKWPLFS